MSEKDDAVLSILFEECSIRESVVKNQDFFGGRISSITMGKTSIVQHKKKLFWLHEENVLNINTTNLIILCLCLFLPLTLSLWESQT